MDFIALNVPGLLSRYENPTDTWQATVLAFTKTQLDLFKAYGLIKDSAQALSAPLDKVVIRFSDYTEKGQAFVKTGAVDKWLASCDRKQILATYQDPKPLEMKIRKFLTTSPQEET